MKIIDSNMINKKNLLESAEDKLKYLMAADYSIDNGALVLKKNEPNFIKEYKITEENFSDTQLVPTKKGQIYFCGNETEFRDQDQWEKFLKTNVLENSNFANHVCDYESGIVKNELVKNFHHPDYENLTKKYDTNLLINYNLASLVSAHLYDSTESLILYGNNIEQEDYSVVNLIKNYESKIEENISSLPTINSEQRHLFYLLDEDYVNNRAHFPFYYIKYLQEPNVESSGGFLEFLRNYGKEKNLFQFIKANTSFVNYSFNIDGSESTIKTYDALSLFTSLSFTKFSKSNNETFITNKDQLRDSKPDKRFANQVNSVHFISHLIKFLKNNFRSMQQIYDNDSSKSFLLGYKIEKYIDNTATIPIQTFYTRSREFIDSQLKYGRKYIYKTSELLCVIGSSYKYSDLRVFKEKSVENIHYLNKKYSASVNFQLQPTFKILEIPSNIDRTCFVDDPTYAPNVSIHRGNGSEINFYTSCHLSTMEDRQGTNLEIKPGNILKSDMSIRKLYDLNKVNKLDFAYFKGDYEAFRLDYPPVSKKDFAKGTRIPFSKEYTVINPGPSKINPKKMKSLNAVLTDKVKPNTKYYYAFRSITYHSTPSQLSKVFEVEVLKDSNDFKLISREYKMPSTKEYDEKKQLKRLVRISPNLERLLFSREEGQNDWELDDGNLVSSKNQEDNKKFKIRITSKHTGKKIDININFKIQKTNKIE